MKTIYGLCWRWLFFFLLFSAKLIAQSVSPFSPEEINVLQAHLLENISSENHVLSKKTSDGVMYALPGAVIASPSTHSSQFKMDYYLSWVRDSAIVMNEVVYLYEHAQSKKEQSILYQYLMNYINWVALTHNQKSIHPNVSTLGEPIFNIDGTIWNGQWSRPQYDGPALQAIVLIHIYDACKNLKFQQWSDIDNARVRKLIEEDMDFVALHARSPSYSLWEEAMDQNFFTEMVQRKALILASQYEKQMGDIQKSDYYLTQAKGLEDLLNEHWNDADGYYSEGIMQQDLKGGSINISVILGALMGDMNNLYDPFAPNSDKMLSTAFFIRALFQNLYFINLKQPDLAPMFGRYLNDQYDGNQFAHGNPWFIATNAMAQFYYVIAGQLEKEGKVTVTLYNIYFFRQILPKFAYAPGAEITKQHNPEQFEGIVQALISQGDFLIKTTKHYSTCYKVGDCLHLSEQVDRLSGKQVSAMDLTWSYVSLLTALQARPAE